MTKLTVKSVEFIDPATITSEYFKVCVFIPAKPEAREVEFSTIFDNFKKAAIACDRWSEALAKYDSAKYTFCVKEVK
tara:strand:+ start:10031 stop:10261 length:231 start_codon:yes stop_codon:yes gene_type:complete